VTADPTGQPSPRCRPIDCAGGDVPAPRPVTRAEASQPTTPPAASTTASATPFPHYPAPTGSPTNHPRPPCHHRRRRGRPDPPFLPESPRRDEKPQHHSTAAPSSAERSAPAVTKWPPNLPSLGNRPTGHREQTCAARSAAVTPTAPLRRPAT
jgi:hypothetical protein